MKLTLLIQFPLEVENEQQLRDGFPVLLDEIGETLDMVAVVKPYGIPSVHVVNVDRGGKVKSDPSA